MDHASAMTNRHALVQSLPVGLEPKRSVAPGERPFPIHQGEFTLQQGRRRVRLRGSVALHWSPCPELRFEGAPLRHQPNLELDSAELRTTAHGLRGRALILKQRHSNSGGVSYEGICAPLAILGQRRTVRAVQFQLVNFPWYVGRPVRFGSQERPVFAAARLNLRAHGWRVDLDQGPKCSDQLSEVRTRGGYATTHGGVIRRTGDRPITFGEAKQFIDCLHFYFGFLAGRWTGPILSTGIGRTGPLWERLGSWKLTAGRKPESWFPGSSIRAVEPLLGAFRHFWLDPLWGRALRMLVYWYVQANAESGSTEAAIVAAFIPLELMAWLVVVEHGGHMSATKFNHLRTAERLEKLLCHCGIPLPVPRDFARLCRSALVKRKGNGPRSLTAIRHALVHPKRGKRSFLSRVDPMTFFELKELALSYVELSLLSVLGYSGMYSRRVFAGWRDDHLQKVPWA